MIGEMNEMIETMVKAGLTRQQAEDFFLESFTIGIRASLYRREVRAELQAIDARRVRAVT